MFSTLMVSILRQLRMLMLTVLEKTLTTHTGNVEYENGSTQEAAPHRLALELLFRRRFPLLGNPATLDARGPHDFTRNFGFYLAL